MYDTLFSIESGQLTSLRQYIKRVKNFKQSYIEKKIKHQSIGNKKNHYKTTIYYTEILN